MKLNIAFSFLFLVTYFKYFIVDVDGVRCDNEHCPKTNLAHSSPKSPADTNKRRLLLEGLSDVFMRKITKRTTTEQNYHMFYKLTPPILHILQPNYVFLNEIYYTTVYDTNKILPVYSAYTIHPDLPRTIGRENYWHTNPKLSNVQQPTKEKLVGANESGYHKGHLYPQRYARTVEEKKKTNLMTNFALQYDLFNINTWIRLEISIYKASVDQCHLYTGAKSFFLTGVIPSARNFHNGINIPAYFWTAVCCDTSGTIDVNDRQKGWSLAYIVQNERQDRLEVNMYFVDDFRNSWKVEFSHLFYTVDNVQECLFDPFGTVGVIKQMKYLNGNRDIYTMRGILSTYFD